MSLMTKPTKPTTTNTAANVRAFKRVFMDLLEKGNVVDGRVWPRLVSNDQSEISSRVDDSGGARPRWKCTSRASSSRFRKPSSLLRKLSLLRSSRDSVECDKS